MTTERDTPAGAATEAHTRLIRASVELLDAFGTRTDAGQRITAEWGDKTGECADSGEAIYEPVFTVSGDTEADRRADLADRLAAAEADRDRLRGALDGLVDAVDEGSGGTALRIPNPGQRRAIVAAAVAARAALEGR